MFKLFAALAALTALVYAHNGKEERILYPAIDREAGEAGVLDDLARRLSASSRSEGRHAGAPASASATSYAAPYPGRKVTPGPG